MGKFSRHGHNKLWEYKNSRVSLFRYIFKENYANFDTNVAGEKVFAIFAWHWTNALHWKDDRGTEVGKMVIIEVFFSNIALWRSNQLGHLLIIN